MPHGKNPRKPNGSAAPLSIEELETGLRILVDGNVDQNGFWDENITAFRQTVLLAIRETSDALLSPSITLHWREELESQLRHLLRHLELANRHIAAQRPIPPVLTH